MAKLVAVHLGKLQISFAAVNLATLIIDLTCASVLIPIHLAHYFTARAYKLSGCVDQRVNFNILLVCCGVALRRLVWSGLELYSEQKCRISSYWAFVSSG